MTPVFHSLRQLHFADYRYLECHHSQVMFHCLKPLLPKQFERYQRCSNPLVKWGLLYFHRVDDLLTGSLEGCGKGGDGGMGRWGRWGRWGDEGGWGDGGDGGDGEGGGMREIGKIWLCCFCFFVVLSTTSATNLNDRRDRRDAITRPDSF